MITKQATSPTVLSSFVLLSVIAAIGLMMFEGMHAGILFFVGYLVVAAISSVFKGKKYYSRRALG
jgi:hypothetical protein